MHPFGLLFFFTVFFVCAFLVTVPAKAGYIVWQDPVSDASMHVPDTWKRIQNRDPGDVVTFRAPGQNQHAECRLRVTEDKRFSIYPTRFSGDITRQYLDYNFWERFAMQEYKYYRVHSVNTDTGLGNASASMADVSYVPTHKPVHKRALLLASLYADNMYIFECSAESEAFPLFHENFSYILNTVRMRKDVHELPSGDYRDFTQDKYLRVYTLPEHMTSNH